MRRALFPWMALVTIGLAVAMPLSKPLFAAAFPQLERPLYDGDPLWRLLFDHFLLVVISGTVAVVIGVVAGIAVTRERGADFRGLVEMIGAMGQTFPPVAVLALTVPVLGFGVEPALIALTLYGLLPVLENTLAGFGQISPAVKEAARGCGMSGWQVLWRVELPLAAPIILAGARTSITVNVGTAALASTVGAKSLGLPIIVGLNASNLAYVIQGAILTGALALSLDQIFAQLGRRLAAPQASVG